MNTKSMILGAAIAVVSSVIVALCVGRPKVLVEAPVTNSYSITNQVNNVSPITNTYSITNQVTNVSPITNTYSITNQVTNVSPITNTYSITNGVSCVVTNNILDRASGFETTIDGMKLRMEEEAKEQASAYAALFVINHVNWVVTKIKNYNDPAVLEEEYKNITADALNLNAIKDQEIIDLICDIMDVITEMRIEEKERAMLKEELDQGMADALYESLSGISTGGGLSPASMAFNFISSAAMAGVNYTRAKRRVMKAFQKQSWSLDKNRMRYLNELNKSLLQKYWAIVQRYNVRDDLRVSESDIALLIDHLKDEDIKRQHDFLVSMEFKYKGLQNYWYYRGLAAQQCGDYVDANNSLDTYQEMQQKYVKMLRIDGIAAKAAMLRVRLMIEDKIADKEAYKKQLKIIARNSTLEEWSAFYFCALVCIHYVEDYNLAEEVLAPVIAHLDFKRNRRLIDWRNEVEDKREVGTTNVVDRLVPSGDAIMQCRTLLAKGAEKLLKGEAVNAKIAEICDSAGASTREQLFYYFGVSYEKALDKFIPDLKKMRVIKAEGRLKMSLPMSWVICREGETFLSVRRSDRFSPDEMFSEGESLKEEGERSIEERPDDGCKYVLVDFGEPQEMKVGDIRKLIFSTRYERADKNAEGGKQCYMVAVVFDNKKGVNALKPTKAYFGPWHLGTGLQDRSCWCKKPDTDQPDFVESSL